MSFHCSHTELEKVLSFKNCVALQQCAFKIFHICITEGRLGPSFSFVSSSYLTPSKVFIKFETKKKEATHPFFSFVKMLFVLSHSPTPYQLCILCFITLTIIHDTMTLKRDGRVVHKYAFASLICVYVCVYLRVQLRRVGRQRLCAISLCVYNFTCSLVLYAHGMYVRVCVSPCVQ